MAASMLESKRLQAVRSLELQIDTWEAVATLPVQRPPRNGPPLTGTAVTPAVNPSVWLLHVRWFRRRQPDVRQRLLDEYEGHARHLAHRYYRHREPLDDLTQVALEALLRALDRFDPRRRIPFIGFAMPTISGALKRHYRDAGWGIRVPRRTHELAVSIGPAVDVLQQDLGRQPTVGEVADLIGATVPDVEVAMRASDARNATSLESSVTLERTHDVLAVDDEQLRRMEDHIAVSQALALLDAEDREVLHRYFVLEMSQEEIAEELGVSQMKVSRLLNRTLRRLRSHLPV